MSMVMVITSLPKHNRSVHILYQNNLNVCNWGSICAKKYLSFFLSLLFLVVYTVLWLESVIKSTPPLNLVLNDEKLQFVENYKYLGATLDNLLNFELHAKILN